MAVKVKVKGGFRFTEKFFNKVTKNKYLIKILDRYGKAGVSALEKNTPKDTGKTAKSWYYEIEEKNGDFTIVWKNSNNNQRVSIALILQYGHATGTGGYVRGFDYINPAMRPIFDKIAESAWEEVTSK